MACGGSHVRAGSAVCKMPPFCTTTSLVTGQNAPLPIDFCSFNCSHSWEALPDKGAEERWGDKGRLSAITISFSIRNNIHTASLCMNNGELFLYADI